MPIDPPNTRQRRDPARNFRDAPPNFGRWAVPQIHTFQGIISTIAKTFRSPDEAIKHSLDNARYMRNDPGIMECLEARLRSVGLLDWHIEVDGPEMPKHKALQERLTRVMKATPFFTRYRMSLLEAVWYGRYANQKSFGWKQTAEGRDIIIADWLPVNGDKLVFRYDDGLEEHPHNQVGIRVGAQPKLGDLVAGREMVSTERGLAVMLSPDERKTLTIHKHIIEDAAYEDPLDAGSIHGIGIRSRIYWDWFQKQELLALFIEYMERSALGFEIWYYPEGNDKARADMQTAAENRNGRRNVILVPVPLGDDGKVYNVERFEPNAAGAEAFQNLLNNYFGHRIKRYILGQVLTSEAEATGLGSGVADLHLATLLDIVKYDATNLEETITREDLQYLKILNCHDAHNVDARFVIQTQTPDVEKKLEAMERAWAMGARIPERDVMDAIGASMAEPGQPVLQKDAGMQQQGMGGPQGGNPSSVSMAGLEKQLTEALGRDSESPLQKQLESEMRRATTAGESAQGQSGAGGEGPSVYDPKWKYAGDGASVERYGQLGLFDEDQHPRAADGKFAEKGGGDSGAAPSKGSESDGESKDVPLNQMTAAQAKAAGIPWRKWHDSIAEDKDAASQEAFDSWLDNNYASKAYDRHDHLIGKNVYIEAPNWSGLGEVQSIDGNVATVRVGDKAVKHSVDSLHDPRVYHEKIAKRLNTTPDNAAIPGYAEAYNDLYRDDAEFRKLHESATQGHHSRMIVKQRDRVLFANMARKGMDLPESVLNEFPLIRREIEERKIAKPPSEARKRAMEKQASARSFDEDRYSRSRYAETPAGARWITIGAQDGEGGTPVLIDGSGHIHAGPKALTGKKLSELSDGKGDSFDPSDWERDDRPALAPSNRFHEAIIDAAVEHGVNENDLKDTVEWLWGEKKDSIEGREEAKKVARQRTGLTQQDVERLNNAGLDYASGHKAGSVTGQKLRHFDAIAHEIARDHPELGLGDPDSQENFAANLWDVLAEGKQAIPPKHDRELIDESARILKKASGEWRHSRELEAVPFAKQLDLKERFAAIYERMANKLRYSAERIPGGLASGRKPEDFDPEQLAAGIKVEMEHTDDPAIAQEIAMDHLTEDPDYYKKLATIEKD